MEDQSLRYDVPPRQRAHLVATIASLLVSLLLVFGGDAFGRFHPASFNASALSRTDGGQMLAGGQGESRFLTVSDHSYRAKARPWSPTDGCIKPDIQTLWACHHGDLVHLQIAGFVALPAAHSYRSRAPPSLQHIA